MTRFKDLTRAQLTDAQRRVYNAIASGPRGGVQGPFKVLLASPELADRVQHLGEFARYRTSLPPRLSELAILITARFWDAEFEWNAHVPEAIDGGLAPAVIAAVAQRVRPDFENDDEAVLYDFCAELLERHRASDQRFADAVACFGEAGVVELVGVLGYYSLLALVMNAFEVPPAAPAEPPLA
ncbi:MAG: carboxymuconolactone decarboxylase family protein [Pseudomonadota bacterium]